MAATVDLLLCSDFPPMTGGIARWMAAMAEHYPPGQLIVSTGVWPGSETSDAQLSQRIDRVRVRADRLRTVFGVTAWSRRAVALVREATPRFAWCDTLRPAGYAAYWAYRRTGLPYGILAVGNDVLTLRPKLRRSARRRRVMRAVLEDAAVMVAISRWTAEQCVALLEELEIDPASDRVRILTLGTDPDRWRPDPAGALAFRERRGLPAGRWLVTVARLESYKGIDTGIEVVAALAAAHPDLHYAVIGRGPDESRLRALAARLGVGERVHFLTGVTDRELASGYSVGDIYLGLTRETVDSVEGFGLSLVEAAACGLPVVATRSGGIPDAVADGESGVLVPATSSAAAVSAVERLLRDDGLRAQFGVRGRELVLQRHNWDRVVAEMRDIAGIAAR